MSAVFFVKALCRGCNRESEHVVNRETYAAQCPFCPQHLSIVPQNGQLVPDKCPACGRWLDDHRWVGNVAQCKETR